MGHQLGQIGEDIVSGYRGVIMGRTEYLTGCHQLLLVPQNLDEKGERKLGEWFDDVRIKIIDAKLIVFPMPSAIGMPAADALRAGTGCDETAAPTR